MTRTVSFAVLLSAVAAAFLWWDARAVAEDPVTAHRDADGWIFEDLEAAYAKAAESGKPLLVAFR